MEKDEIFATCAICMDSMNLDNSTLINCGHVYHYDCIQQMYHHDWSNGKVSTCTMCRVKITSKPNRLYGKFSKEAFVYKIPKDGLQPNINGTRRKNGTSSSAVSDEFDDDDLDEDDDDHYEELIEFYDGRLRDLEGQLRDFVGVRSENAELKRTILEKQRQLKEMSRELNGRNLKLVTCLNKQKDLEEELDKFIFKYQATKAELDGYKNVRIATEVERLTTQISRFQTESYFKTLLNDPEVDKEQLLGMLAGLKTKIGDLEGEKFGMERELRSLKIFKERAEKRERQFSERERQLAEREKQLAEREDKPHNKREVENNDPHINMNPHESIVDEKGSVESHQPNTIDPYLVTRTSSTSTKTSKMVPTTAPKGLKVPKSGTNNNGTGKRMKIIDMPDGRRFFI